MLKILNLKLRLLFVCLCLATMGFAQNPIWSLPPNYYAFPGLYSLPTNAYTWNQPGVGTVQPGYGYGNNSYSPSTILTDWDQSTVLNGPNNMYADENGKPLFSIMSGYIFNSHGFLVDTLIDTVMLTFGGIPEPTVSRVVIQGYTEACIVPNPGNCKQYYIFTAMPASPYTLNDGSYGQGPYYNPNTCWNSAGFHLNRNFVRPYYTLLDVSQTGPYMPAGEFGKNLASSIGAVGGATAVDLYKKTGTQGPSGTGCSTTPFSGDIHYAVTRLINKTGTPYRLVFLLNDDELITYKITATGVQWLNTNAISTLSANSGQYSTGFANITELEVYQDYANNKIKVAFGAPNSLGSAGRNVLVMAQYDTTGVFVSGTGSRVYGSSSSLAFYVNGLEFSPNGTYLYCSHTNNTDYPTSVDRVTWSTGAITSLSTDTALQYSQVETGIDGNLYLVGSGSGSSKLAKISSPNTGGTLTTNILSLSGYSRNYPADIVYTANPVYFLPDQIDGETYGSQFNSPISCCLFYQPYDRQVYYAGTAASGSWTSTTQTWSQNTTAGTYQNNPLTLTTSDTVTIGQELRIPAGYTVTINNMKIKFSPQARLIIEGGTTTGKHGGKLILSGCTLTVDNRCITDMWPGVQVWGSPTHSQSNNNQGYFSASNCVIQNAYIAVLAGCDTTTWLSGVTPAPPALHTQANCLSLGTSPMYGGGGIAYLYNTKFLNNQKGAVFYDFSYATAYSTVNTCTFSTNAALLGGATAVYDMGMYNMSGTGFYIYNSNFSDSYNNYSLTGLYTYNSTYNLTTSGSPRSTFSNFLYGIYSYNTSGNTATISAKNTNFNNNYYGIYLGYVNNASVSADTFRLWNTYCTGRCNNTTSYGLYLDNCHGYQAQTSNYTRYNPITSSNKMYGILANNSGAYVNCIYNNTFDHIYKGSQAQYRNYASYSSSPHNYVGLVYLCNQFSSGSISGADIYVPARGSSANVGSYSGSDTAAIQFNQGSQSSGYPQTGGNLFSHTSGGSDYYIEPTAGYAMGINYIYHCTGTCTGAANFPYNNISSYVTVSPFSGADVNCTYNPYTMGLRMDNPLQAMLNGAETYKLTYDSIKTVINSLSQNDTTLFHWVEKLGIALSSRHRLLNEAVHYYLDNPDSTTQAKINDLMRTEALELPMRSQLETALNLRDSAWATSALNKVTNEEGQSNYVKLHSILLANISKTAFQLLQDPSIRSQVVALAADSSDRNVYLKANALLASIGLSTYKPYIQEDDQNNNNARITAIQTLVPVSLSTLYNQPNPFKESTTIQAHVAEKTQNAYLLITDMMGAELARYPVQQGDNSIPVNAANLSQSVMFCTLVVDGVRIKTNKMVLIK